MIKVLKSRMLREVAVGGGAASPTACVPHEIPREAPRTATGAALGPRVKAKGLCPPVPGAPAAACVSPAERVQGLRTRPEPQGRGVGSCAGSLSVRFCQNCPGLWGGVAGGPGSGDNPAGSPGRCQRSPAPEGTGPQGPHLPGSRRLSIPPSCGGQGWRPCALHPEARGSCGARPGPTGESQAPSPLFSSRDRCREQPRSRPVAGSPRKGALIRTPGFRWCRCRSRWRSPKTPPGRGHPSSCRRSTGSPQGTDSCTFRGAQGFWGAQPRPPSPGLCCGPSCTCRSQGSAPGATAGPPLPTAWPTAQPQDRGAATQGDGPRGSQRLPSSPPQPLRGLDAPSLSRGPAKWVSRAPRPQLLWERLRRVGSGALPSDSIGRGQGWGPWGAVGGPWGGPHSGRSPHPSPPRSPAAACCPRAAPALPPRLEDLGMVQRNGPTGDESPRRTVARWKI